MATLYEMTAEVAELYEALQDAPLDDETAQQVLTDHIEGIGADKTVVRAKKNGRVRRRTPEKDAGRIPYSQRPKKATGRYVYGIPAQQRGGKHTG